MMSLLESWMRGYYKGTTVVITNNSEYNKFIATSFLAITCNKVN